MTDYQSIVDMAQSNSLLNRVAAAAAAERISNPQAWAFNLAWEIVSYDYTWADDWSYARDTATPNQNPDTGARTDVIGDPKILSVVQALKPKPDEDE